MKRLIEYNTEDGQVVVIEVDEPESEGTVRASRPGEIAEKAKQSFEAALAQIKPAATTIMNQLQAMAQPPDQVDVEFGIKLGIKAGAIIASTDTDAHFKIALKWTRKA